MLERILRIALPFSFLAMAIYAIALCVYEPRHNWDVIGYIAAAKSLEQADVEAVHEFTYAELRNVLPASTYESLVHGRDAATLQYEYAISTDVSAFKEQLPFYQIRPIYVGAVYLLYKSGLDIEFATRLISGVAVAAGLLVLYLLARAFLPTPLAYALLPLALLFRVMLLAVLSTPDGLAFCAVMLSAYLYLRAQHNALLIVLPLMLGVRTDLILFTMPLLIAMLFLNKPLRRNIIFSIGSSAAIYAFIVTYWKNPGWTTFFYCSTVQRCTHPISSPPTLKLYNYIHTLADGVNGLRFDPACFLYAACITASLYLIWKRDRATSFIRTFTDRPTVVLTVCVAYTALRFLVLPEEWERFFPAQYLLSAFSLFWLISNSSAFPRADSSQHSHKEY